jgi:hypothetical protein
MSLPAPITVVAVANGQPTEPYLVRGFNAFKTTSAKFGYDPIILGWGQPWRGLGCKPKLLLKAIREGVIKTPYIIFADAFDVWFTRSPSAILEVWRATFGKQYEITWNAERNCFPRQEWAVHHPQADTSFRYLNSGLSIGRTEAYEAILSQMQVELWPDDYRKPNGEWVHRNDQDDIMAKFLFGQCASNEPKMNLDSHCSLFQTLCGVSDNEITESGLNIETGQTPRAWHSNGPAKTCPITDRLLTSLGL